MSDTYSVILLHIIFSTKRRNPWLTDPIRPRLFEFLGGIARAEGATPLAIGGATDHVHMLNRWRTDRALGDLMREVKARSSRWLHQTFPEMREFAWQGGYGAFSIGKSQEQTLRRYIAKQAEHHASRSFMDEFRDFLDRYGAEYDPKYLNN